MNKKTLAVLTAALFGLAACGSGSKGHSGMINTESGTTGGTTPNQPQNTPSNDNKDEAKAEEPSHYGNVIVGVRQDSEVPSGEGTYKFDQDNVLSTLEINGYSIELIPEEHKKDAVYRKNVPTGRVFIKNAFPQGAPTKDTKPYLGSGFSPYEEHGSWSWVGNNLSDVKYGTIYDDGERQYTFVQGKSTPKDKMPPAERKEIHYKGQGTHHFNELDEVEVKKPDGTTEKVRGVVRSAFLEADVDIKVNFGEKSLSGKITPKDVPAAIDPKNMPFNPEKPWQGGVQPTYIKATIDGNKFAGTTYLNDKKATEVKGGFYGNNAGQIGGTYKREYVDDVKKWTHDNYPTTGVFGAERVPESNPKKP